MKADVKLSLGGMTANDPKRPPHLYYELTGLVTTILLYFIASYVGRIDRGDRNFEEKYLLPEL